MGERTIPEYKSFEQALNVDRSYEIELITDDDAFDEVLYADKTQPVVVKEGCVFFFEEDQMAHWDQVTIIPLHRIKEIRAASIACLDFVAEQAQEIRNA